jgi:hypothetical protein
MEITGTKFSRSRQNAKPLRRADAALGFSGSQQGLLMEKLAVNAPGAIAVVNSTFKGNETSHIWLFRGQAAGR